MDWSTAAAIVCTSRNEAIMGDKATLSVGQYQFDRLAVC
jgi:hypothetical protein